LLRMLPKNASFVTVLVDVLVLVLVLVHVE
jgi:hypothetical protein